MFFSEKYSSSPDPKMFKWIGREIEYRDCEYLRRSGKIFRGRIIKIHPSKYATVQVTHVSSIFVKIITTQSGYGWRKTKPKKTGKKFPWKEITENEFHLVRLDFCNRRWKMIESQSKKNFKTEIIHVSPFHQALKEIVNEFRKNYLSCLYFWKTSHH